MSAVTPTTTPATKKRVPEPDRPKGVAGRADDFLRNEAKEHSLRAAAETLRAERAHLSGQKDFEDKANEQAALFTLIAEKILAGIKATTEVPVPALVEVRESARQEKQEKAEQPRVVASAGPVPNLPPRQQPQGR